MNTNAEKIVCALQCLNAWVMTVALSTTCMYSCVYLNLCLCERLCLYVNSSDWACCVVLVSLLLRCDWTPWLFLDEKIFYHFSSNNKYVFIYILPIIIIWASMLNRVCYSIKMFFSHGSFKTKILCSICLCTSICLIQGQAMSTKNDRFQSIQL